MTRTRTQHRARTGNPQQQPSEQPEQPGIEFQISGQMLHRLLHLPLHTRVISADVDPDTGLVTFGIEAPDAPAGSTALHLVYHHDGRPDPISVRGIRYATEAPSGPTP
ncbi:hypothetical protein [Kutzneria albida]|uniref:Uncharacterized protein n=1 Tax=Kutzneria albida DSM 43870 TaxID=1449976 RepID=W5WBQ1_9PSEU|nr:hypothetical protein [Kutzneria albida]AHH98312.1 hypothetical protein KALB_4950 [Kutzneria albida DSM 43870]